MTPIERENEQDIYRLANPNDPLLPFEDATHPDDILAQRIILTVLAGAGEEGLTEDQVVNISDRMFSLVKAEILNARLALTSN